MSQKSEKLRGFELAFLPVIAVYIVQNETMAIFR